jgi:hypothetical protein
MMVHSLFAAPDGVLWMNGWDGTQGSGFVTRTDGKDWTVLKSTDASPGPFAVEAVSEDGRAWGVVAGIGLASFNGASTARSPNEPDNIATKDEIRAWSDAESWSTYPPPEGASLLSVRTVASDGALWITTDSGIARFDPGIVAATTTESDQKNRWTFYSYPVGPERPRGAVAVEQDGDGIWIGATHFEPKAATKAYSVLDATRNGDAACQQEWDRTSADLSSRWQTALNSAAIKGIYSSSASVVGECADHTDGSTVFVPASTWFYVGIGIEGNDYDQIGDALAECLNILVDGFRKQDLRGATAVIYGTLSAYRTDAAGWPGEWVHYFSLSYEDAQTATETGFEGTALLDALAIHTPVRMP